MFYYRPPKSSIWGHKLRKMPAARERALFRQFLDAAVGEFKNDSGNFSVFDPTRELIKKFEALFGMPALGDGFFNLNGEQCELVVDEVIKTAAAGGAGRFMLLQSFEISKWRIDGNDVPTNSRMGLYYGKLPCVSTFLHFNSQEEFHYVKRVLEDLNFCKLNEKHLKVSRAKR
jgi:hypothetical protein